MLQLQSLPVPLSVVEGKPQLLMDNIPVVALKTWPLAATLMDGRTGAKGPLPVLFTEQPAELRTQLEEAPQAFAKELAKVMTR